MSRLLARLGWLGLGIVAFLAQPADAQYERTNLVSNGDLPAEFVDPHLVNAWGLAHSPTGPFWVADNGTALATVYDGQGQALPFAMPLAVNIPLPGSGAPTGVVFNSTSGFVVRVGGDAGPARFIFASEDGTISGWNGVVDPLTAILAVDHSGAGAVYKGVALGGRFTDPRLFVTNFHAGVVEVYNHRFAFLTSFTDPTLPTGYAPFGIRVIKGLVFVTFALQDEARHDDVPGPGHGFVDVFTTGGRFIRRFASGAPLDSPWGLAAAPEHFGPFSGALLVGNFGNGHINAFDPDDGTFLGHLDNPEGNPLVIDGLWGLDFGNDGRAGPMNTLHFTAGPNHEADGLFGKIEFVE
jgi:uncharacterized protein (TIGR03118 family)